MKKILLGTVLLLCCRLEPAVPATPSSGVARQLGNAFADAVERVMPAVVVVRTESTAMHAVRDMFLGGYVGIPERLAGQGSGVIISREGHVLTSHHVIRGAQEIEVVLHDGTKHPARLVGRDPWTDLAVLKIEAGAGEEFTPIESGDSDRLRVGEFVIAVGSPFSLDSSVTAGIVSQKGRSVGLLPYEDFIQTDAPINPGNSGGPLVDVEGRMVGINAVIQTGGPYAQGNIGIGFAVPVNLAMRVAEALIAKGRMERPWIGVQLREQEEAGGTDPRGVLVGEVFENSPAARCGLRDGDLITSVDGEPVHSVRAVQRLVFRRDAGDSAQFEVRRGPQVMEFEVVTETMPDFGSSPD